MAWLRLPSITATQGSITVTVNNDFETEHIQVGDGLLVGQFALVEIVGIHSQQLTLKDAWSNATQTNVAGAIVPTASDFQLAANLLREATTITHGNFAAMEQWWTENTDVTFTAYDGSKHSVPSAQKMQDALSAKGTNPYEHQYNKIRNALRNLYDASGIVHWGKHGSDPINQGMYTDLTTPNSLMWGGGSNGDSETAYPVINVAGHEIHVRGINHSDPNTNRLVFQDAENGTRTVNTSTGVVTQHADATTAFAAAAATNVEVIVRRVDLKYGEAFLEVDPVEMFPYGMCKSGLASIDGIATEPSSRPDSYHAAFLGEVVTNKQCVKVAKLTFVQLAKLMSNPMNNLFYNDDGALTQYRYRDKVVGGAGNGDWLSINPNVDGLKYSQQATVVPQGMKDSAPNSATTDKYIASPFHATATFVGEVNSGVYIARNTETGIAYKGECYALVLCTVPRLNMGGDHPLNPFGTSFLQSVNNTEHKITWWGDSGVDDVIAINSVADCFTKKTTSVSGQGDIAMTQNSNGNLPRDDGKRHDAIYASGFNGVIDHRQPAKSPQDSWKESLQGFYAAKVRGVQKLPFTVVTDEVINDGGNNYSNVFVSKDIKADAGDRIYCVGAHVHETRILRRRTYNSTTDVLDLSTPDKTGNVRTNLKLVVTSKLDTSVSGEFSCNTVIADPANWVQTPQIAQGVIGVWSPVIPDGKEIKSPMVRKVINTVALSALATSTHGASWGVSGVKTVNNIENLFGGQSQTIALNLVYVVPYKAYAYQVEDGENLKPVEVALVNTFNFHRKDWGALFHESALHKINVNDDSSASLISSLALLDINRYPTVRIDENFSRRPKHAPLSLSAPTNDSPACKALPFLVEKNGYLYIAWHVNELVWKDIVYAGANGTLSQSYEAHKIYRITDGAFKGKIVQRTASTNAYILDNDMFEVGNGDLVHISNIQNGNPSLYSVNPPVAGWGDDSKIKVTSKGWDTYLDLNGNTMTRRIVISTFPIGPAKKKTLVGGLSSPA
ncbi:hypothetical protein L1D34_07325 [Vibrio mediterranei]|uniref:hypothetical protein n=1 Tax=Vibrio mediterranei TaxID=689 RepID=UPI001EFE03D3|nr:hypothetical protein [Vibrio mediterranei]MCG9624650.1 hypothetical protein [Vibrio mediterranei]